ncbi:acyl-CoA dehydrogenase family protein [Rhodococcus sp. JVH1]|jgi:alkylation response protein AidB-like acyl-CoA dehydrogenase|uniref:acyl-CoA dehydrogenase family protein n=1 Tax=Rhodococcus sp. JVH1 TaxID=745408 RepID=UPI000271FDFA|nr:acyl-CoA dehydrogenase family protein [Rhodococcus sp. JVH1]EJI98482.1 acyl-CoA dehydrogenase, middle domain protein [Rhodococcus sp. JVH1]
MTTIQPALRSDMSIDELRTAFRRWLTDRADSLEQFRALPTDVEGIFSTLSKMQRELYEAGWIRLGWPEELGGLGGVTALRAVVSEELAGAGYPPPFSFATQEVLGPAIARYARSELATEVLPRLLRGEESWCQGFSEPGAGSDLASLRTKAVDAGDHWVVNGEKIWTSWAQFADRCIVLTRTGAADSAHRGITALFVDMDTPGITVSPLVAITGEADFSSLHFDNVQVPKARTLGDVGSGWAIAMFILSCERGAAAWQRQAWMRWRLDRLVADAAELTDARAGEAFELITALRLLSRRTLRSLSAGRDLGVLPSFDKYLMSTAEKFLFDTALQAMPETLLLHNDRESKDWRTDYLYSRASSIYGGAKEIQRNVIAERILGLPREK